MAATTAPDSPSADSTVPTAPQEQPASFITLPGEIIGQIALETCTLDAIGPPIEARALCLTCRTLNGVLSWRNNQPLYAAVFANQFDLSAPKRRCRENERFAADGVAREMRRRWRSLSRMRRAVKERSLSTLEADGDLETDLWVAYLLLMEDDGKNMAQLRDYVGLDEYMGIYWREDLLPASVEPSFPAATVARSLALWIMWFTCSEHLLSAENTLIAQTSLSALRPYAFAAHHFDIFYAPWYERLMPLHPGLSNQSGCTVESVRPSQVASSPNRQAASAIEWFGRTLYIDPPKAALAAIMLFSLRTSLPSASPPAMAAAALPGGLPAPPAQDPGTMPPFASEICAERRSLAWDIDWKRQIMCWDQWSGAGLGLDDTTVVGVWEGKFTFFDFDSYRDMLVGSHRAVYDGSYGAQPQIWRLQERRETIGEATKTQLLQERHDRVAENDGDLDRENPGLPEDSEPWRWEEEEIAVRGTGHSAWGQFNLVGSIRSWDGLISLRKEYTPEARGTWLYRGYLIGGNYLVGRWRDTFTEKTQFGYEGIFAMARRS